MSQKKNKNNTTNANGQMLFGVIRVLNSVVLFNKKKKKAEKDV